MQVSSGRQVYGCRRSWSFFRSCLPCWWHLWGIFVPVKSFGYVVGGIIDPINGSFYLDNVGSDCSD